MGSGSATRRSHTGARLVVGVAGPLVLVAGAAAVVPRTNTMVVTLALMAAVLATARFGWPTGTGFAVAGVVTVSVATLASPSPAWAAVWMLVVGAGVAPALARGLMPAYVWLGIATGLVVVSPQPVDTADKTSLLTGLSTAWSDVAVNAAVGLVVAAAAIGWLVLLGVGQPRPTAPALGWAEAIQVAVVVALTTAVGTLVVLQWYRLPVAGWFVLTVYVVAANPGPDAPLGTMVSKALVRTLGTVFGAAAAVVVAQLVSLTWVLHVAAVGLFVAAMYVSIRYAGHYWWYVVLLTASVVLANSVVGTTVAAAEYRLAFTVAAVVAAVAMVVLVRVLTALVCGRTSKPAVSLG